MRSLVPLFPEQASALAARVDVLFLFLVAVSVFFASLIFLVLLYFAIKYRRRSAGERPRPILGDLRLELLWTIIPLGIALVSFTWGATLYFEQFRPPAGALEISVVGKQWMWKFQHPEGQREINELHIPVGRPVKLTMTSEDVIHDFFVPAFRTKMDVLPGRYTTLWFEASKPGAYHLFCAQYCGTQHAGMIGRVIAMPPVEYEKWLGGAPGESLVVAGERLFLQLGCQGCHQADDPGRGPSLRGLFGQLVPLQGGGTLIADEAYIRESILNPLAKLVASYPPIMPTFRGRISEEGILQIIAYIKSLGRAGRAEAER